MSTLFHRFYVERQCNNITFDFRKWQQLVAQVFKLKAKAETVETETLNYQV